MTLADLISYAERLKRQSWRLYKAKPGDDVVGYWGGSRSDLSTAKHIFSFDVKLLSEIGLKPRHLTAVLKQPFALAKVTRGDSYPTGEIVTVSSGTLADSLFEGGIPLAAVALASLPPVDALLLYGDSQVKDWVEANDHISTTLLEDYRKVENSQCSLFDENAFAQIGGWHSPWPEGFLPREMQLIILTLRDAEPWYEVFLPGTSTDGTRNLVLKDRIT